MERRENFMSIVKRIRMILISNIQDKLENIKDPETEINRWIREMEKDLREFKAKADAAMAQMNRIKKEMNDCDSQMNKLERYAKRALEDENEDRARRFLEDKATLIPKYEEYKQKYELASIQVEQLKLAEEKLTQDVKVLSNRRDALLGKLAVAKSKMKNIEMGTSQLNVRLSRFEELEEEAMRLLFEAEAMEELRNGSDDDMDR